MLEALLRLIFRPRTERDVKPVQRNVPQATDVSETPQIITETLVIKNKPPKVKDMFLRKSKRNIHTLFVHSTATKRARKVTRKDLYQWHVKERGWSDIGYHGMIHRDGTFQSLRSIDKDGAHAYRHNRNTIGVVMVGGLSDSHSPEANFTRAQFRTLKKVIAEQQGYYEGLKIKGHRDVGNTACPSFDVQGWMKTGEVNA